MKYIIIDRLSPVIFTDALTHAEIGRGHKVTSAGFVNIEMEHPNIIRIDCYGESLSLDIKSEPENDAKVIHRMFRK